MRKATSWRKPIAVRLRKAARERGVEVDAGLIAHVELGLTLLRSLCPTEAAQALWGLLGGYPFPVPERQSWTQQQRTALAVARFLLAGARGRRNWERMLRRYQDQPGDFRIFDVDVVSWSFTERTVAMFPERHTEYWNALLAPPEFATKSLPVAGAGPHRFRVRNRVFEVNLPAMASVAASLTPDLGGTRQRTPILVPMDELKLLAREMDMLTQGQHKFAKRMADLNLEWATRDGDLAKIECLPLDGLVNLVGMLGAGKSTVMDVLAVWAARHGYHTTVVLGDTAAVLERAALYRSCGVPAAPLLGGSQREQQIRKFHRSISRVDRQPLAVEHPGFDWISTHCALDGLRQDERPLRPGEEPCDSLVPIGQDGEADEANPRLCPFYSGCPVQRRYHDLAGAAIWVGTPQSLVYTSMPAGVIADRMRLLEAVYRRSDVVIIDEADRVQAQLDLSFIPEQTLVNERGGWLGELLNHVKSHSEYLSRGAVGDSEVAAWVRALGNADAAANRIYEMLQQRVELRRWLGSDFFTGNSLFDRVIQTTLVDPANRTGQNEGETSQRSELSQAFQQFADDPLGERYQGHHPVIRMLVNAAQASLSADPVAVDRIIAPWLEDQVEARKLLAEVALSDASLRLQLAIAVAVLDHQVDQLLGTWKVGAEAFDITDSEHGLLPAPAEHSLVVPETPMGNILGFQYLKAPGDDRPGLLRFFRCLGLGRWLLLRLPDLYKAVDGLVGPHVVLLSGTSWAPADPDRYDAAGAPGYHLQMPVSGILSIPDTAMENIGNTRFYFAPQYLGGHAIRVSGQRLEQRTQRLEALVAQIAVPGSGLLDRVLAGLPDGRRRVLLLVGSYAEAKVAARQLARLRRDLANRVVRLVADDDPSPAAADEPTLARGQVAAFASTAGNILVTPLLAIERGHNILNAAGEAALGAAMFLVRPMPVPGDLAGPIQSISAWAVRHMSDSEWFVPRTGEPIGLQQAAVVFRQQAAGRWRGLLRHQYLKTMLPDERLELFWSQLILHWQVIGRCLRGGVSTQVYFCDAAYSPETAGGRGRDTRLSSVLLGYEDALSHIQEHPLTQRLYGPMLRALSEMEVIVW